MAGEFVKSNVIKIHVDKSREGTYFEVPFEIGKDVERIDIRYSYEKSLSHLDGGIETTRQSNTIDLGLCAPGGNYLGSSGSDRSHIWVSGCGSAEGFAALPIQAGKWGIIIGAYKVAEGGVDIEYSITLHLKHMRLFKGDTHVHSTGSDGVLPPADLAQLAKRMGLDFLIITDHNNHAHNTKSLEMEGITVIPGTEWTHYKGHAGMLGIKKPFAGAFYTNTKEQTVELLQQARHNGAKLVLDHPFCPVCPWLWGFDMAFDGIEVWNGIMSERNLRAIAWWHGALSGGKKIPALAGSDFHRPALFGGLGMPCMCVYAMSREPGDLLEAIFNANSYISYVPDGPGLEAECAGMGIGASAPTGAPVKARLFGLKGGDIIKIITDRSAEEIECGQGVASMEIQKTFEDAGFCRFEVYRCYEAGLPPMLAMLSNPVYFAQP